MSFLKRSTSERHNRQNSPKVEPERTSASKTPSFISSLLNIFADKHNRDDPTSLRVCNSAIVVSSTAGPHDNRRSDNSSATLDSPATSHSSPWPSPRPDGIKHSNSFASPKSPLPPLPPSAPSSFASHLSFRSSDRVAPERVTPDRTPFDRDRATSERLTSGKGSSAERLAPERSTPPWITSERVTPDRLTPTQRPSPDRPTPERLTPTRPPVERTTPDRLAPERASAPPSSRPISTRLGTGDTSPPSVPLLLPRPPVSPPTATAPAPRRVSVTATHVADVPPPPNTILLCTSSTLPRKMQRPNWSLSDYAIFEKMYTGYASVVSKAWCKRSGDVVCLKQYNLGALGDLHKFQIYREIKLHSGVKHEHIIHLLGAFQQSDQVVMVQEYAEGGDLFLLLHRHGGKLPERQAVELVLQPFLLVLNYLHQNCIAHRDLKPENILFTRNNILKLCDFGLAIDMREERAVTRAGTLEYMAPEVLNCPYKVKPMDNKEDSSLHYSTSVDSWAVGILTYELLMGLPPFSDSHRPTIEEKIRTETPKFNPAVTELARNFITLALQKEPHLRPTVLELLHHPWIHGLKRFSSMSRVAVPPMTPRPTTVRNGAGLTRRSMCYDIVDDGGDSGGEEAVQAAAERTNLTTRNAADAAVAALRREVEAEDAAEAAGLRQYSSAAALK